MSDTRAITREQIRTLRAAVVDLANPDAPRYLREDTAVSALRLLQHIDRQLSINDTTEAAQ